MNFTLSKVTKSNITNLKWLAWPALGCCLMVGLGAQLAMAQDTGQDAGAKDMQWPADKPELPIEQDGALSGDQFEYAEPPLATDDKVVEALPVVEQEPLIEVAPAAALAIREAAPPTPNANGMYAAADLIGAAMLSGPGFTVAPEVEVRGYMLVFTLHTRYGDISAESKELLPIRIDEVAAIERLERTGLTSAAGKQAKRRSTQVWTGLKRIFTKPKETVAGLPQGVARMVKERAKKIGRQATKLYDKSRDEMADDENAPAPTGPFTAARAPEPEPDPNQSKAARETRKAGKRLIKQELGFSGTRRFIAREVGVDPYSRNPVLNEKLDALAWSATGSDAGFKLVMGALGAATAGVLPQLLKIDRTVWEESPENLGERNRVRLNDLGCAHGLTRRFVRNGAFTPTLQTELVSALTALKLPKGCDDVLDMAIDAQGEVEARFVTNSLRLLLTAPLPGRVGYGAGECEIEALGGGLGALCRGELLVPVPVDALIWDEDMASFLEAENVRDAGGRTILMTGFADREARVRLTDRGFAIVERAPLN